MAHTMTRQTTQQTTPADRMVEVVEPAPIFGLRYIEEEAAEIHDVVGCRMASRTATHCDDSDALAYA
jgi:hypothetical protein